MIFGINTTRDISKLSQTSLAYNNVRTYNNFEISLVVFKPNITTNHAITYTNLLPFKMARYSFSGSIPPKFEHKLRRHKQSFGKIATTVVLDKDDNDKIFSDRYCDDYASLYLLDFPSVVIQVRNFNGSCA